MVIGRARFEQEGGDDSAPDGKEMWPAYAL